MINDMLRQTRLAAAVAVIAALPAGAAGQGYALDFGFGGELFSGVHFGVGVSTQSRGYSSWDSGPAYDFRGGYHGWNGSQYAFADYAHGYGYDGYGYGRDYAYGAVRPQCAAYYDPWAWDVWTFTTSWRSARYYDCIVAGPTYGYRGLATARYFDRYRARSPWRSRGVDVWAGALIHRSDPFWPTWGPYWAYDPWDRWDRHWPNYGPTTVVVTGNGRRGSASPWAWGTQGPAYKEGAGYSGGGNTGTRTAIPRSVAASPPTTTRSAPASTARAPGSTTPPAARSGERAPRDTRGSAAPTSTRTAPPQSTRAAPRPSDGTPSAVPGRTNPTGSTRGAVAPSTRRTGTGAASPATVRVRPSDAVRGGASAAPASTRSPASRGGASAAPATRSAPTTRSTRPTRSAPATTRARPTSTPTRAAPTRPTSGTVRSTPARSSSGSVGSSAPPSRTQPAPTRSSGTPTRAVPTTTRSSGTPARATPPTTRSSTPSRAAPARSSGTPTRAVPTRSGGSTSRGSAAPPPPRRGGGGG